MTEKKILILTEANEKVASGHLFESIVLYNELYTNKISAYMMINSDMQPGLKSRITSEYYEYSNDQVADDLIEFVENKKIDTIVFNLREIKNCFIEKIKNYFKKSVYIIIIDEFGHRRLDADIIINPMIDSFYWNYETDGKVYCGAKYLILPQKLKYYHGRKKEIRNSIETITVSMGGIDIPGSTIKLAKWLYGLFHEARINLVLGGGFPYIKELKKIVCNMKHVFLYQNIAYLYDLFMESDIAICAGGNTLHEVAALGVPTLVIPSMPHEERNGKAFEMSGFSICCESADRITRKEFDESILRLSDIQIRKKMSAQGKLISDGKGAERVYKILANQ